MSDAGAQVLVLASASDLPRGRIWGTGGWVPPSEREALDWLTFIRLCGWRVAAVAIDDDLAPALRSTALRTVVIACAAERLSDAQARRLEALARERPVLVVGSAAGAGSAYARIGGVARTAGVSRVTEFAWRGPGEKRRWQCRNGFDACDVHALDEVEAWADAAGKPLVMSKNYGRGAIVTLAFDAAEARERDGAATALLRHTLAFGARAPVAWLDWTGTMVLRMDDPGGAQNVHSRSWRYPKLDEAAWDAIGAALAARDARMSVAYVPGWVDDGECARGALHVEGKPVARHPGAVYPSSRVSYIDTSGESPQASSDYVAEHAGVQRLRRRGLGEVELHGHTHIHPDRAAWLRADDRHDSIAWFRELGESAAPAIARLAPHEHPLALGLESLRAQFDTQPTTLVCPGDDWTDGALERALELGMKLVSSYYLAVRHGGRFCWATHVCAPYLDEPDARWFDAGLPVVGYFHDREPALMGVEWFAACLARWSEAGAARWIDFRELASALCRSLEVDAPAGEVVVHEERDAPPLVRPLPVRVYSPAQVVAT